MAFATSCAYLGSGKNQYLVRGYCPEYDNNLLRINAPSGWLYTMVISH